jgi:hypothetical protein
VGSIEIDWQSKPARRVAIQLQKEGGDQIRLSRAAFPHDAYTRVVYVQRGPIGLHRAYRPSSDIVEVLNCALIQHVYAW